MLDVLRLNLLSPIPLAFALGVFAKLIRSELNISKELYRSLTVYLLLALGLKGGVALSHADLGRIALRGALYDVETGAVRLKR